jgi:hypothetical protein
MRIREKLSSVTQRALKRQLEQDQRDAEARRRQQEIEALERNSELRTMASETRRKY